MVDRWERIKPRLKLYYLDLGMNLELTMVLLGVVHNFKASPDQFKRQMKKWPEFQKNSIGAPSSTTKRTRPKRSLAREAAVDIMMSTWMRRTAHCFRRSLTLGSDESLAKLLYSTDKYIKGFFDGGEVTPDMLEAQFLVYETWENIFNRSQMLPIIRGKDLTEEQLPKPPPKDRTVCLGQRDGAGPAQDDQIAIKAERRRRDKERRRALRQRRLGGRQKVVADLISDHIISQFDEKPVECSPYMLPHF
ncbi:hypothetical protein QBC40DRAFT_255758 [Triangularia verruculosa]|uniref:Clr5 domain-containing protein n=1 Tax=Triangularia verruculosa TaxID=2587418 RepID=A0AAN7AVA7_9PEZI|nr:hypothetical protein QBC40DRAFT_255758 [Triangularia verruculosa]